MSFTQSPSLSNNPRFLTTLRCILYIVILCIVQRVWVEFTLNANSLSTTPFLNRLTASSNYFMTIHNPIKSEQSQIREGGTALNTQFNLLNANSDQEWAGCWFAKVETLSWQICINNVLRANPSVANIKCNNPFHSITFPAFLDDKMSFFISRRTVQITI